MSGVPHPRESMCIDDFDVCVIAYCSLAHECKDRHTERVFIRLKHATPGPGGPSTSGVIRKTDDVVEWQRSRAFLSTRSFLCVAILT